MDMETITAVAWIIWLVLVGIFLVIEMFTLEFTFLMLALGSVVGLIASLAGADLWLQIVLAGIAAILLLFLLKPPLLRALRRGEDQTKSNVDALIGMSGVVLETVTTHEGQVKLSNGDIWRARSHGFNLPPQTSITVAAISGATAEVVPTEGN